MADWPALDVRPSAGAPEPVHTDFVIAAVDAFAPTAVEEHGDRVRIFFATTAGRDAAASDLASGPMAGALVIEPIDVPDEDWARRSQAALQPITIGRLTIRPAAGSADGGDDSGADRIVIIIPPSTGFGTGHHATTQLCLEALQSVDLRDRSVVDVGTGSGILAIAASRLGAAPVMALDHDEHALAAAAESLALNRDAHVALRTADLVDGTLPTADVVVNLTGALLVRAAATLAAAVKPGGLLIVSGLLVTERADVSAAFRPWRCTASAERGEWAALVFERPTHSQTDVKNR